jgi:hypothetical protein
MTARHSILPVVAGCIALVMSGVATPGFAQGTGTMPKRHDGMSGMPGMSGMMAGPHHVLAMGYRANLMTFARAVRAQSTKSATVDLDLARPAVAEMRRSLDQMQQHHAAQMATMGPGATPPMKESMDHMASHLTSVTEHLTALEAELNASTPDPKRVSEHASGILKECDGMAPMAAKGKPHSMK